MAFRRLGLLGWLLAWALAAAQHKETFTYNFDLEARETRYFEVTSKENDARLKVQFEVLSPQNAAGVRVALLSEEQFQQLREQKGHGELTSTAYLREGNLRTSLAEPGRYVVVIENAMERRRCRLEMGVVLTTGPEPETLPVTYASPQKRLIVVGASVAGFLLILTLSARALWRATRR